MKKLSIRNIVAALLPVVLFAAIMIWIVLALNNAGGAVDRKELENVKTTVEKGVTMCYAIEGVYPESLDYLKENYGIIFDSNKFIVHYDRFADNIRPIISVMERGAGS